MRWKSAGAQGSGALCVSILFSLWAKSSIAIKYPLVKARKNQRAQKDAQKRILHFIEVHIQNAITRARSAPRPDAAVYWLARMLEAGEDPLYIARRVTRFASEDVGLADPRALEIAVAAYQACHFIGMPECTVHLTEAVVYLALALPDSLLGREYYRPTEQGVEGKFKARLQQIKAWKAEHAEK